MSVEAPKPVEETPVVETTKALPDLPETSITPTDTTAAPHAETIEPTPAVAEEPMAAATTEEPKKDETAVEPVPASEGVLGYKEPTFFKYVSKSFSSNDMAPTDDLQEVHLHQALLLVPRRVIHRRVVDKLPAVGEG